MDYLRSKAVNLFSSLFVVTFVVVGFCSIALASSIDVSARDAGEEYSVRKVWDDGNVRMIGVIGDEEFTIEVGESNPNGIDTCWIYIDGTYTTGTERNFTATDYRVHYGIVIILYDNDTYESKEFHVKPSWDPQETVATGATAPLSISTPEDETAAGLMEDIAEVDPDGPTEVEYHMVCKGDECYSFIDPGPDECTTDLDCW